MALPNITKQDIEDVVGDADLSRLSRSDIEKIRKEVLLRKFSNKDILRYQANKTKDRLKQWGKDKLSNFGDKVVESIPGYGMYQRYKSVKKWMSDSKKEARDDYLSRFGISDSDNDIQKIEQDVDTISDTISNSLSDALESGVGDILEELGVVNTNLEQIIENQENGEAVLTPQNLIQPSGNNARRGMTGNDGILVDVASPEVTSMTDSGILLAESQNTLRERSITGSSESSVEVLRDLVGIEQNMLDITQDDHKDDLEEKNEELDRDETIENILTAIQQINSQNEENFIESAKKKAEEAGETPLFGMLSRFITAALPYLAGIAAIAASVAALLYIADKWGKEIGEAGADLVTAVQPEAEHMGASDATIEQTKLATKKDATNKDIYEASAASVNAGETGGFEALMEYFHSGGEDDKNEKPAEISKENVKETARSKEKESTISSQKLKEKTSELKENESSANTPIVVDASKNTTQKQPQQGQQMNQNVFSTRNPNSSYTNMSNSATNYPQNR
jgi:hypothetical protein